MASNQIRFNVGFNVDRTGLNELQNALRNIQTEASRATGTSQMEQDLRAAGQAASQLSNILNQSWNNKLGQLDLSKVNSGIKKTFGSVQDLKKEMEKSGPAGSAAYNQVASSILNTNLQLKQSNKLLDEMALSMANTVKWGITSSIFNNITGSIQKAYGYTKKLDSSLNDIRIVTDKSAESMEKFAVQANQAAKGLGASTIDYTQASLIYYQQGLEDAEVSARAETTLKAANVTGQSGAEVSEQLTAVWNGYKVTAEETELYVDKLAAVAATTAADLQELSTGMSKVASAANIMGVDIDQLNAQLATIVSVTREAPESIGTALKTVYARMSDITAGLDGETSLDEYTSQMAEMGINVLDTNGSLRDMGDIVEEIGGKWGAMTREQQTSLAQTIAGTRQYSRMMSLFDNWDMYTEALKTSTEAAGTLQNQQDIYMESTEAHLKILSAEAERTYDILFNQDTVNGFADTLTGVLGIFNDFIEGVGGGGQAFIALGGIIANVFSKQIGNAFNNQLVNMQKAKANADGMLLKQQIVEAHLLQGDNIQNDSALNKEVEIAQKLFSIQQSLSSEEYNRLTTLQQEIGLYEQQIKDIESYSEYLEKNNLSQETSLQFLESNAELKESELQAQKDLLEYLELCELTEQEIGDYAERRDAVNEQIFNENSNLAEILAGMSDDQLNILETVQNEGLEHEEIVALIERQRTLISQQEQEVNEITRAVRNRQAIEDGTLDTLRAEQAARENIINQQIAQARQQQTIQQAVQGATALLTIGTSLVGVIKTLNNEDLSFEEKLTQSMTVLLTMLPMVISNLSSIRQIIPGVRIGLTQLIASYGKGQVAINASNTLMAGSTLGLKASIAGLLPVIGSLLAAIAPYAAIVGAVVAVVWLAVKAHNADAEAAKKAAEAYKEAAAAAQEATAAYEELAKTISEYEELADGIEKLDKSTQEYKDSLEQANEKAMELIRSNKELAQYAKRSDQGLITFEGNEDKVEEILKQEKRKKDLAIGAEYLAENEANRKQLKSDVTDFMREIGEIRFNSEGTSSIVGKETLQKLIDEIAESNLNGLTKDDLASMRIINSFGLNNEDKDNLISAILSIEPEIMDIAEQTRSINATEKLLLKDTLTRGLENDEDYAVMSDAEKNAVAVIYGRDLSEDKIKDLEKEAEDKWDVDEDDVHDAYAKARGWTLSDDKIGDKAVYVDEEGNEHTITDDSAREHLKNLYVADKLADYDKEKKENIKSAVGKINDYGESYDTQTASELLGFATKEDQTFDASTMSLSTFNELENQSLVDMIASLSDVTLKEWEALGYKSSTEYAEAVKGALTPELKTAIEESTRQSIIGLSDGINTLTKDFQSGDITSENISENEEYQNIIGKLEDIKILYPELTTAAEVFSNTNLVGTQMWTESLYELQDAIDEVELKDLKKQLTEARDAIYTDEEGNKEIEFEAWVKSDEFEKELDAILNAEYAISVEIHSQAEGAFDSITSAISNIEEQAGKIGDDFIVAAEDLRELNNAFPGILQGIKNLNNGTVKLNKETVKSAMQAAETEITADVNKTNGKLKNAAEELRVKQKTYQAMADAAKALASGEMEADKTQADYEKIITEGLSKLDEEAANTEMENDALVATNSNENAKTLATNWSQAYQSSAESAKKFAEAAVQANQVAEKGEGSVEIKDFGVNYTGGTGKSSEASQIQQYQELFESGSANYAKLAESFQEAANAFGKRANDIEGMMYESGALVGGILKGLGGVAAGRGIDDKKDKNGSGDKDKREADFKNKEDEIDRYWELNKAIEEISENISDLQKKQDKLHGKELIESLKQENKLLNQQKKAYQALKKEQKKEAKELRKELSKQGIKFNKEGEITNYLKAYNKALNEYNAAGVKYEAGAISEAAYQAAQQKYEKFKESLERYEELYYKEMIDTQNKIDDTRANIKENKLELWEIKIEVELDLEEAKRDWNNFTKEMNEDFTLEKVDVGAELESLLQDKKTYYSIDFSKINKEEFLSNILKGDTEKNKELLEEATTGTIKTNQEDLEYKREQRDKFKKGEKSIFSSESEADKAVEEADKKYQKSLSEFNELNKKAYDNYLEGIDQFLDGFEEINEKFERINENLEYQGELIELIYGEEAYYEMSKLYEAQVSNSLAQIETLEKERAELVKLRDAAAEGSKERAKYEEALLETEKELNNQTLEHIKLLKEEYTNTVKKIFNEFEKSLTGGSSFDELSEELELSLEDSDRYFDDTERLYETQTIANKTKDAIANTSSLKNQQKLQSLYDKEIKYLREKKDLTQYDVDAAEARLEIAMKEIALEDARNAKNSMKLTRGADGNWSYQYVADLDDISQKQQDLIDANNNLYQLSKDAYEDNLKRGIELGQWYKEEYLEIMLDTTLKEDEKNKKIEELKSKFETKWTRIAEENTLYRDDMIKSSSSLLYTMCQIDEDNIENLTDSQKEFYKEATEQGISDYASMAEAIEGDFNGIAKAAEQCMLDSVGYWDSGTQQLIDKMKSSELKDRAEEMWTQMAEAADIYDSKLTELQEKTNQSFEDIPDNIKNITTEIGNLSTAIDGFIKTKIPELAKLKAVADDFAATLEALYKDYHRKKIADSMLDAFVDANKRGTGSASTGGEENPPNKGELEGQGTFEEQGNGKVNKGDKVTLKKGVTLSQTSKGEGKEEISTKKTKAYVAKISKNDEFPYLLKTKPPGEKGGKKIGWVKKKGIKGFDTGGYTGNWQGNEGKLAVLHKKELILKSSDTENILNAVKTVRGLSELSSSIENMIMKNLNSMISKMSNLKPKVNNYTTTDNTNNSTENIFHVTAEFPNANDVTSIKEAFLSLPNIVSQYIAENKK